MTTRPRTSLLRIVEDLGSSVLDVAASPGDLDAEVTGVHIYDPLDEMLVPAGGIVLGVGVEGAERITGLLAAARPAAGLVVKQPVHVDAAVLAAVRETGVALLGLTRAASWSQVAALLRSLLAEGQLAEPDRDDPSGDLFSLANAVCALLDAPVTIEDRSSRVLAYSGRQDEADPGRVATVLGRQVPARWTRMLEERGFFRELYQSHEPIHIQIGDGTMLDRVAVAVRSGDEILGSIWAAVREPLTEQRRAALADAAKIVALQLLRERAGADARRRLRADLLATVLEGGAEAAEAAGRLGVASERLCVLAAQLAEQGTPEHDAARVESDRQRFCDALALHVAAIHPRSAAALIGSVAYAVLPLPAGRGEGGGADAERRAVRVAESFLARVGPRHAANIGVGRFAGSLAEVARSRADADRALRVLRARGASGAVADYTAVHFESLLLQLSDLARAEDQRPTGPYERLLRYDAEHGTELVATLRAYLDAFGDVNAAAARVHVHANTFRYRLKRLTEIGGLDLSDPDVRLGVMLQLRIFGRDRRG
ncbi:DNA-binding PucR family transcriptional regulator [Thermocatellispora tengchongensis]|uniref:DNA-binding PucR family transcriptional regulator n=1 Tax=Thermocatellispora tengchongensis TaxID=1073253 RepID=A0A840PQ83_9ACTN|nr:helix-turn-helix domain-containing protein [Thermocatellispora tengchongensis]MBB5139237.1 DNA-binding PucR family transcriptional regulator [Thermocatellispora tengchongensis]